MSKHRWARALTVTCAVATALAISTPGARGEDPDAHQLEQAIRVRSEVGFNDDPRLVSAILARNGGGGDRGAAFTAEERHELEARAALVDEFDEAVTFATQHASDFGGVYFDHTPRFRLVINVLPTTPTELLSAVEASARSAGEIEFRPVSRSLKELEVLRDELYLKLPVDPAKTAHVDPVLNTVVITVSKQHLAQATSLAREHAGAITVEVGQPVVGTACVSRSSCEIPWRGGIVLSGCTWGFYARSSIAGNTEKYALSAGHCSHLGDDMLHDGAIVNTPVGVTRNTFDMAAPTSESMRAPLQADGGARNLVYISAGNMAYAITGDAAPAAQQVGNGVAISGRSSLYLEGLIQATNIWASVCRAAGDCYNVQLNRATFNIQGGDSGAPIIHRTLPRAFGITYGTAVGGDNRALYSPIHKVVADMSARLCLDAACS